MQRNSRVINSIISEVDCNIIDNNTFNISSKKNVDSNKNVLIDQMLDYSNKTLTDNGATTNKTSKNSLLDFYMNAGSMRHSEPKVIIDIFEKSLKTDPLRTIKCVFHIGDIRGGLGERLVFNILLEHIAHNHPELLINNLHLIPYYSRWDYMYSLFGSSLEDKVIDIFKNQLISDLTSDTPSLLAKWIYSSNATSKRKSKLGQYTAKKLALAGKNATTIQNISTYRKTLSKLRKKLNIVERLIASKNYEEIEYSNLPSHAAMKYSALFERKDYERYLSYINALADNTAKVNAATLYPHNIVGKILSNDSLSLINKVLIEKQWTNLPDYIQGKDTSGIVVADVSGSMYTNNNLPINVSISMALYMSERCSGPYKNKFITFSQRPEIVEVQGDTIAEKVENLSTANWDMNTNVKAVFDLILEIAVENNLSQNDLPNYLYIISDMQFDSIDNHIKSPRRKTLFETITKEYLDKGYTVPKLVFWNVNATKAQSPMSIDENGWLAVSGFSTSIFKALMDGELLEKLEKNEEQKKIDHQEADAVELMKFVLDSERYSQIKIS